MSHKVLVCPQFLLQAVSASLVLDSVYHDHNCSLKFPSLCNSPNHNLEDLDSLTKTDCFELTFGSLRKFGETKTAETTFLLLGSLCIYSYSYERYIFTS